MLSSFDPHVVATASEAGAEAAYIARETWTGRRFRGVVDRTSIPVYPRQPVDSILETALEAGCVAVHPRLELCLRTDLIERAHDASLRVEPWTITDESQARKLADVGVDGLITDVCTPL